MAKTLTDEEAQWFIDEKWTPEDLVRLLWVDADDGFAHFILWERTPFPLVSGVHDIMDALMEEYEREQADM